LGTPQDEGNMKEEDEPEVIENPIAQTIVATIRSYTAIMAERLCMVLALLLNCILRK